MDFNIDSIKEEFENFRNNCGSSCITEQEEIDEVEEEEDGFIGIVQKYVLAPNRCGVYLSRLDIKAIGLAFGEDVQVRERKRMLRDILKAVTSKEKLEKVFSIIKEAVDTKLEAYEDIVKSFPATKELFEDKFQKAKNFKKVLDNIVEDIDEEVDFV